jgi:hypothetical protein
MPNSKIPEHSSPVRGEFEFRVHSLPMSRSWWDPALRDLAVLLLHLRGSITLRQTETSETSIELTDSTTSGRRDWRRLAYPFSQAWDSTLGCKVFVLHVFVFSSSQRERRLRQAERRLKEVSREMEQYGAHQRPSPLPRSCGTSTVIVAGAETFAAASSHVTVMV